MQFFILLIGVMVFIFYQFNTPPMVFNSVEEKKVEQSSYANQFNKAKENYEAAHTARKNAAENYVRTKQNGETNAQQAREDYLKADAELKKARESGVKVLKEATGNKNYEDVNYVFPMFVVSNMPAGVVGLIIAAIFAAAMSSISAELNALATATTIDFYKRHFNQNGTDKEYVFFGRIATGIWGIFACAVALYATQLGSLIEVVNKFGSFFYGSLLGVFVLAIAVPRARARGAFWGLIFGIASVWIASRYTDIAFLWFNLIGCIVVVVVGYLLSLTVRKDKTNEPPLPPLFSEQ
jgi:Na+(H+)/acetate symporter ActP